MQVDQKLSDAIEMYINRSCGYPKRDVDRVLRVFGATVGPQLVAQADKVIEDAMNIYRDYTDRNLPDKFRELQARHPELTEAACNAIACHATFCWR